MRRSFLNSSTAWSDDDRNDVLVVTRTTAGFSPMRFGACAQKMRPHEHEQIDAWQIDPRLM